MARQLTLTETVADLPEIISERGEGNGNRQT